MTQVITATFVDGVLRPEEELTLASGTKVRLLLDLCPEADLNSAEAFTQLDRLCAELPVDSLGSRLTREQLHERR